MKKRYIISSCLAIIVTGLCYNFWLIFSPMNISFKLAGTGNAAVIVQVDRKNNGFTKLKSAQQQVELNEKVFQNLNFNIDGMKKVKAIRIVLNNITVGQSYRFSPLSFCNGRYSLDDISKYQAENGLLTKENGNLKIVPNASPCVINYTGKISGIRTSFKFDICVFLIILILSFLLSLKLVYYLADFKDIKHQSRIEIVFLTIFFVMLFIPMSHINNDEIAQNENRRLAQYKSLFNTDKTINFNYGKDFNTWFNDRFAGRHRYLKIYSSTQRIQSSTRKVDEYNQITYLNKNNNWIFTDDIWENNLNWTVPTDEELVNYEKGFEIIKNDFKKLNIPFYIVAVPTRERVLVRYQLPQIRTWKDISERAFYLVEHIKKTQKYDILYPLNVLRAYNGNGADIYYKTDHHYTDFGAEIVYKYLFDTKISKDFPEIKLSDNYKYFEDKYPHGTWGNDAFNGSLYNRLGLNNKKMFDVNYKFLDLGDSEISTEYNNSKSEIKYRNPNAVNHLRVYIIGDSFVHSMGKVLAYQYAEVTERRDNMQIRFTYDEIKKDIAETKPDLVIFIKVAPHITHIFGWVENKNSGEN